MNIGAFDRYILIETQAFTQNDYGENVGVWSTFLEAHAMLIPSGGGEKLQGGREVGTTIQKYKTHFFPGVKPKMRLTDEDGDVFDITLVQPLGREAMMITAQKKDDR